MTTEQNPAAPTVREPYDAMGPIDAPNPPAARATLATVQPGGRVRLGHHHGGEHAALTRLHAHLAAYPPPCNPEDVRVFGAALAAQPSPAGLCISDDDRVVLQRLQDALPTVGINGWSKGVEVLERLLRQSLELPSPAGQGDALPALPPMGYEVRGTGMGPHDVYYTPAAYTAEQMRDYARAALAARQPVGQDPIGRVFYNSGILGIEWREGLVPPPGAMLYAAPPAQAVDQDLHQHLLDMLGAKDHEDAGRIIGKLHAQTVDLGQEEARALPLLATESMLNAGWPCGEVIDSSFDRQGAYADMVAAAPPAQAVDLGQFNALAALANAVVHHGDESPMKNGVFAEAERLLALIESQAVSK